jgi:hypothetical protein
MANFENKDIPSKLDTGWQKGAVVKSLINVEDNDPSYQDMDCTNLSFAWFRVESNMQPSPKEEEERQVAIRRQFELKVINKYGLPYGMPMPKEFKEQVKAMEEAQAQKNNKWARKRQKLIEKQIEKDMKRQKVAEQRNSQQAAPVTSIIPSSKILSPSIQRFIK